MTLLGNTGFLKRALLSEFNKAETRQHNVHQRNHKIRSIDQGDGTLRRKPFIWMRKGRRTSDHIRIRKQRRNDKTEVEKKQGIEE
jgi:hypothetical protein